MSLNHQIVSMLRHPQPSSCTMIRLRWISSSSNWTTAAALADATSGASTATTKTDFAYCIDRWDPSGNVVQRVADVDDLAVAVETYEAACKRWPGNCFAAGFPCNRGQPTDATH